MTCSYVRKETDHKGERLGNYTYYLNRYHYRKKPEWHAGSCKNMPPVILVSAELCNNKCEHCKDECYCYISCHICTEGRWKRDKPHKVVDKDEEEDRKTDRAYIFHTCVFRYWIWQCHHAQIELLVQGNSESL